MEIGGRVEEARTVGMVGVVGTVGVVGMVGVVGTVGVVGMVGVAVAVGSHHLGAASTGPAVRLDCARRGQRLKLKMHMTLDRLSEPLFHACRTSL